MGGSLARPAALLRSRQAGLARAAAEALAQMPDKGWLTLDELSASPNPLTAGAAFAALDRARRKASV